MSAVEIVSVVFGCVAAAAFLAFMLLYRYVRAFIEPRKREDDELIAHEKEVKKFSDEWTEEKHIRFEITSRFGYRLVGYYYDFGAEETVVLLHGHNSSHVSQLKYMELFKKLGYNVFIPDHRRSGASGGDTITFGAKEKIDAEDFISYIKDKVPGIKIAGLFGESMGAATAMMLAPKIEGLGFLIEYCGYANFEGLLLRYFKSRGLTRLGSRLIGVITKCLYGFDPKDTDALRALKTVSVPVLIMHSKADEVVVFENAEMLRKAKPEADFVSFDGSRHACSYTTYPEEFEGAVRQFLEKVKAPASLREGASSGGKEGEESSSATD